MLRSARWLGVLSMFAVACSGEAQSDIAVSTGNLTGDTQVPPVLTNDGLEAWLAKRHFDGWTCEPSIRPSRPPGGTAPNRVWQNDLSANHGDGEYPVGSTSVRELYDNGGAMVGHAVTVKVAAGGGNAWFWYEKRGTNVVASGRGDANAATEKCVACHERANPTTLFGHDLVFNQLHPPSDAGTD
jgi:hypothetical protein